MKTNVGLIEYCEAQLGKPYWYGTFGQTGSASLYNYNKGRLPAYYAAADFTRQFGQRVHDCIGLIKGYLWSDTPDSAPDYASNGCPDHSANSMLSACAEKGAIGTIPETPGALVFMPDHIGVYIGGGYVIEARGHAYGVVKTRLKDRPWKNWGICPYITYIKEEEDMTKEEVLAIIREHESEKTAAEPSEWSGDARTWAEGNGIITGDGSGNMQYKAACTREQMVVFLYRLYSLVKSIIGK